MAKHVAQHMADQVAELVAQHVQGPAERHRARHASRLVVYTAILGTGRQLLEAPPAAESSADFLCFTDDPGLRSETWEVIPVEARLPTDLVRSERHLKIVGHPALAGYDRSLWLDSAVELTAPPESFVDDWLEEADVAAPVHTFYRTVLTEAEASIDLGKDDHLRVFEQLAHYVRTSPTAVESNPHWTAMLARRHTAAVDGAMTTWWEHVLRFSRRDQLSFAVVMADSGLRLGSVSLPNLRSPLHRWPDGWATRADDRAHDRADDQSGAAPAPRGGDRPSVGRHARDPALLRAEIEAVLDDDPDDDAWIWDLEERLRTATVSAHRLRGRLQGGRGSGRSGLA